MSLSLGQEKQSSLLQTFKNTSDEFGMPYEMSRTCWKASSTFFIHSLPRLVFQDEEDFSLQVSTNRQNNLVYFNDPKYFSGSVQEKVYNGCYCYPFATIDELKRRIVTFGMSVQQISPKSTKQ